jgi:hypothetical protein
MHAFPIPCTYAGSTVPVSSLNLALPVSIHETKGTVIILCVKSFQLVDEIASGWITILDQKSFIKIETSPCRTPTKISEYFREVRGDSV